MSERVFSAITWMGVFSLLLAGILSLQRTHGSSLDRLVRQTGGQRIHERLTPEQADYILEVKDRRVRLSNTASTPIMFLNFWATFCPTCIEELPSLLAMAGAHQGLVTVVAVSYDESWDQIEAFFERFEGLPPNFLVVRDPFMAPGRDLKSLFGTEKLPESYIIRGDVVEARYVSSHAWDDGAFDALLDAMR